jgi:hypothetical protein
MPNVIIPLVPPIKGHKGPIDKITIREPTFDEYKRIGDPFTWLPLDGTGTLWRSDYPNVISAYMDILVEPELVLLEARGFQLAREIKQAIVGFFLPAAEASEGS